jgi:hypothetical protein
VWPAARAFAVISPSSLALALPFDSSTLSLTNPRNPE